MNNAPKKKILLVDDDEMHLITAELYLKDEYEVIKIKSGMEALNYLANSEHIPDLIMLDILMPEIDGWHVFKRIRSIQFLKNIPVIFLTSETGTEEKQRAFKMGAAGYVTKPYNFTKLKSAVKDILDKKK